MAIRSARGDTGAKVRRLLKKGLLPEHGLHLGRGEDGGEGRPHLLPVLPVQVGQLIPPQLKRRAAVHHVTFINS